ncbi:hypothetical protein CPB84DRAFT_1816097 [Gymnopilus junonius]|uniref:Mitochondrial half-size ABC transporter n=1 Tax=Gymnopilus junonius TaxID=109634 RepID=A0A9P5TKU4_GYMJU|nr:hypothetical protein CPB84DRAFT_1816097 [Gymnopilus junonius]
MASLLTPTFVARVLSPGIFFLSALSLLFTHPKPPSSPSPITPVVVASAVPRRALILTLLTFISFTYLFDGLSFVVFALVDHEWPRHSGIPVNTIIGLIAFSGLAALGTWKDVHGVDVWSLARIKTATAATLLIDIGLTVLLVLNLRQAEIPSKFSIRSLVHLVFPAFRVLLLCPLLLGLSSPRIAYSSLHTYDNVETSEAEPTVSTFLLPPESSTGRLGTVTAGNAESSKYGTFRVPRSTLQASAPVTRATTPAPSTGPDTKNFFIKRNPKSDSRPEISFEPSWAEIWRRIRRLTPYLWPKKNASLQLLAVLCIFILLIGRIINLAMPLTLGKLISILEGQSSQSPWPYIFGYTGLRFLQGSGGLPAIRDCLWAPVMQYSDREMSQLSFDHLLNLSYAWHTRRKTGEILRVLDRGAAINHTLELVLFSVFPTFIDILVALVAFCIIFQWTLALVIFIVMFAYVAASVVLTQWRTRIRRQMNERDVITRGIHTDCLLNYETVKYFGGEEHEGQRYSEAIRDYQALEYKVIMSLNLLNLVQNFIITSGLLVGSIMVAYDITSSRERQASKFVIFITYLAQLYGPLNQLGYIYRSVNQSLVDTEKLLALLNEPTEVDDKKDAPDLVVHDGEIEFDDVHFSYDGRSPALDGVSFKVPKGASVALVGESGAGKSTILRLLYRFYDLGEGQGRILIDSQDIRDVTQKSLRQAIGVVPQDPVLFNSSIGYNIGYGKFGATSEEIEVAASSAQMHERIMTFPDGYNTKVGERGVRLSGGEKQRVAIARTLLKNPPILLLDEATSALDTSTEKDIQKALQNLVKGRSSLSIAHRLSTIASADIILVLKDGRIVEQGNFKELIERDGLFASMWADQISSNDDPAASIGGHSIKKEVSGYNAEITEESQEVSTASEPTVSTSSDVQPNQEVPDRVDISQSEVIVLDAISPPSVEEEVRPPQDESRDDTSAQDEQTTVEASVIPVQMPSPVKPPSVAFPSSEGDIASPASIVFPISNEEPASLPVAFPTSENQSDKGKSEQSVVQTQTPGVTFSSNVDSPPSRTGTPNPESEPKRKRISSQNFQRLARRISLTTRRQSSSSSIIPGLPGLPGLKRDQSPRVSSDDASRPENTAAGPSNNSPAPSFKGEDKPKSKKKDKKDKSKKGTI